ncbi:MAG: hypothetical protein ACRELY_31980, partial [Polyangiaceae bacterium]
ALTPRRGQCMYNTFIRRFTLLLAVFAIGGCSHEDSHATTDSAAPSASETAFPSGTPLDKPLTRSQPVRPKFPCRAIEATNKPTLLPSPIASALSVAGDAGSNFLARDMQIPEGDWIDLTPGAKVTAKSPRTLRETSFEGPALVRPCVDHDEEAWLVGGTFAAVSPGNESPGAEELVVTPLGVVRYVSATFTAHVDKRAVSVKVNGGSTYVLVPPFASLKDGSDAGAPDAGGGTWLREDPGFSGTLAASLADDKMPAAAALACKNAAAATKAIAAELLAPDASIGTLGPQHTESRRLSHGLCSIARLVIAKMPDDKPSDKTGAPKTPTSKSSLQDAVDAAEKDWRTLP